MSIELHGAPSAHLQPLPYDDANVADLISAGILPASAALPDDTPPTRSAKQPPVRVRWQKSADEARDALAGLSGDPDPDVADMAAREMARLEEIDWSKRASEAEGEYYRRLDADPTLSHHAVFDAVGREFGPPRRADIDRMVAEARAHRAEEKRRADEAAKAAGRAKAEAAAREARQKKYAAAKAFAEKVIAKRFTDAAGSPILRDYSPSEEAVDAAADARTAARKDGQPLPPMPEPQMFIMRRGLWVHFDLDADIEANWNVPDIDDIDDIVSGVWDCLCDRGAATEEAPRNADLAPGSGDARYWQFEAGHWRELLADDPTRKAGELIEAEFRGADGRRILHMDEAGALWLVTPQGTSPFDGEAIAASAEDKPAILQALRNLCAGDAGTRVTAWKGALGSGDFVAGFSPPDYLIDGIVQRRFIYSLTAKTGTGKTALALLMAASVALGQPIGGHEVAKGRVLYLAGENPEDIRARWLAMADQMEFDAAKVDVHFLDRIFNIDERFANLRRDADRAGGVQLVIVDTSAAYFTGSDENSNAQMVAHAHMLRRLTELPGGPCVIVCAHPTKNAGDGDLMARGGGAFVNEMDGNLTATRDGDVVRLHWQTKFRGPGFAPVRFGLRTVTSDRLKDSRGRLMPTVVAYARDAGEPIDQEAEAEGRTDSNTVLHFMLAEPNITVRGLAAAADWRLSNGKEYVSRVTRALQKLAGDGLAEKKRDGSWHLTAEGQQEAEALEEHWAVAED